jgi:hypothetical protein
VGVAGVVHHQIGDHPHAALMSPIHQLHEIPDVPEVGQHLGEVGDVVAAVAQRRVVDGQQPDAVDAEPLQIVEAGGETAQVTGAVPVGIMEPADQHLVEDRALVPLRVAWLLERERVGDGLTERLREAGRLHGQRQRRQARWAGQAGQASLAGVAGRA